MTDLEDEFTIDLAAQRRARIAHVAKVAGELGTRGAARRLSIDKDTVTRCLRLVNGPEPSSLILKVKRDGPRGFKASASGMVRRFGKRNVSVRFACLVEALTLREVLEAVVHQAMAAARKKAGRG